MYVLEFDFCGPSPCFDHWSDATSFKTPFIGFRWHQKCMNVEIGLTFIMFDLYVPLPRWVYEK